MVYKGVCELQKLPNPLTVGTVLNLSCKTEQKIPFKNKIFIHFPSKKDQYKLKLLKVLRRGDQSLDLQVTSYQTGVFSESFFITDGASSFSVDNLSFTVASTLEKGKSIPPHPPLGPWQEKLPLWYLSLCGGAGFFVLLFGIILIRRYIKRKIFIKNTQEKRGFENPTKRFVREARREEMGSLYFIPKLEKLFQLFLQDLLFIKIETKKLKDIEKDLKKYEAKIYRKHGQDILNLLKELAHFHQRKADEFTASQLKRMCYKLAFDLEQEKR